MSSPLNGCAPLASLIATLCGTASLLLKWIVNGASAGALTSVCSNATLTAEIWTAPSAGADEPPSLGAAEAPPLGAFRFLASLAHREWGTITPPREQSASSRESGV